MKLENFNGDDYKHSTTCFKSNFIDSFDLQLDSRSLAGYPITRQAEMLLSFYYRYLNECNFYQNSYSTGPMTYEQFHKSNFFIIENLKRKNVFRGQLTLDLKKRNLLFNKLFLIIMPVYQKQLTFDEHLNVAVADMDAEVADTIETYDEQN